MMLLPIRTRAFGGFATKTKNTFGRPGFRVEIPEEDAVFVEV
jgi:hypothetical protein